MEVKTDEELNKAEEEEFSLLTDEEIEKENELKDRMARAGVRDNSFTAIDLPSLEGEHEFTFNWRKAYENVNNKELSNTPNDVQELDRWILGQMGRVERENLQKVAAGLRLYNPVVDKWDAFLSSDKGQEFKKMLADTRAYKQEQDVKNIWDDKSVANKIVNLTMPVTKEYAKQNWKTLPTSYSELAENPKMAAPIVFDAATNAIMMGIPGRAAGLVGKPLVGYVADNAAAPIITEAGQMLFNEKDLPEAAKDAGLGVVTNFVTPRKIATASNRAIGVVKPPKTAESLAKAEANKAANETRAVMREIQSGKPYVVNTPKSLSNEEAKAMGIVLDEGVELIEETGGKVLKKQVPATKKDYIKKLFGIDFTPKEITITNPLETIEAIPEEQLKKMKPETLYKSKSLKSKEKDIVTVDGKKYKIRDTEQYREKVKEAEKHYIESLQKHGNLSGLTREDKLLLGLDKEESMYNYLANEWMKPVAEGVAGTYGTNLWGRPEFGQSLVRSVFPFVDSDDDKEDKMKSKVFTRDYLLGGKK